jgi:hypothetical protein
MSFRSNVFRASISSFLVLCFGFGAFADTIRMKDGSKVKGKIVSFSGGKFVIAVGDGSRRRELTLIAADVESIDFDTPRAGATNVLASNRNTPSTSIMSSDRDAQSQSNSPNSRSTRGTNETTDVQASTRIIRPTTKPVLQNDPVDNNEPTSAQPEDNRVATNKPSDEPVEEDEEVVSVPSAPAKPAPQVSTPAKTAPTTSQPTTSTKKPATLAKPVALSVKVLADNTANGWTNSGWVVKKGQRIRISGTGEVSIGGGKMTGPGGLYDLEDNGKLLKSVPTGALIAVIGDDNNEFIYVGTEREFVASRDGSLFLGLNEANLNDNKGSFEVKVEISPDDGE